MIHIEMKNKPLITNSSQGKKNVASDVELFQVIASSNRISVLVTVEWSEPNHLNNREFKVVKLNHMTLTGVDSKKNIETNASNEKAYPYVGGHAINSKGDISIVHELFSEQLAEFGMKLNNITTHSLQSYESDDFEFYDTTTRNSFYDLIDTTCKKVMAYN